MRPVRRHDFSPRVEMMPMIDVVFLLLTFFIYAMVVLVELKSSGVTLISVEGGDDAVDERVVLVEIDGQGGVLIDGRSVAEDELDGRLREIAGREEVPPVIVTGQDVEATVDRLPVMLRVEDKIRAAGITNILRPKLDGGSGVQP